MTSADDRELREALDRVEAELQAARVEQERLRTEGARRRFFEEQLERVRQQLTEAQERQTHLHAALSTVRQPTSLSSSIDVQLQALRQHEEARRPQARWVFAMLAVPALFGLIALAWTAETVDRRMLVGVGVFLAVMIFLIKDRGFGTR